MLVGRQEGFYIQGVLGVSPNECVLRYIFPKGKCPTKCVSRQYKCGTGTYRISEKVSSRMRYIKLHPDKEKMNGQCVHREHLMRNRRQR